MKQHGCDFCNDLRNVEPAKYVGGGDENFKKQIEHAKKQKKFLLDTGSEFIVIERCPVCGYKFTEEDYDSYD
jgi:hypothetical protein